MPAGQTDAPKGHDVGSDNIGHGAAGFIGFHIARRLLADGRHVVGLDNLNDYYDPALKHARLNILRENSQFSFVARPILRIVRPWPRCLPGIGSRW